jgi:hypothetical protein
MKNESSLDKAVSGKLFKRECKGMIVMTTNFRLLHTGG